MTKKKLLTVFAALAAVGIAAIVAGAFLFHLGPWERTTVEARERGPVIATVNAHPIYLGAAQARVEGLTSVHGGDLEETMGKNWQQNVLDSLIDDQMILEEAERRGLTVTDQQLQEHVTRLQAEFESEEAFQEWLASQNIDLVELERRIQLQTLAALVYEAVTADVHVTGDEIRDYYRSHLSDLENADGSVPSLLEVRVSIRQALLKQQQDEAFTSWLDGQRSKAQVVILIDDWWRNIV